jgi:hypothetical protein
MKRMDQGKEGWFDKPRNVTRLLHVFYPVCSGLLTLDFIHDRHVIHAWEKLWGFYGLFGFLVCVALVLVAKEMRKLLKREEGYYDDPGSDS